MNGTQTAIESSQGSLSDSFRSISIPGSNKQEAEQASRTYKRAKQLYLTRQFPDCYATLEDLIKAPPTPEHEDDSDEVPTALVARKSVSTNMRVRIWCLYISLLNEIVALGPEDGKQQFGNKQWRDMLSSVQNGQVWETVVETGYGGRESLVDSEVVYNLYGLRLICIPIGC